MTSLIDYTYFTSGRLVITGLAGGGIVEEANITDVEQSIVIYEKKILKRLFGTTLYAAYVADMETVPVPSRWNPIISLLLIDQTNKISPLANLIYYYWVRDHQTLQTAGESVKVQATDTTPFVNVQLICDIYNDAISDLSDVYDYLVDNASDYPEWDGGNFGFSSINVFDI